MNWYKLAKSKLEKILEKRREISLEHGWSPSEVDWAENMSLRLQNASYFMWLLEQARNKSANIETGEDDQKVFQALQAFEKYKKKGLLNPEQSDINQIKTVPDLIQIVSSFTSSRQGAEAEEINQIDGAEVLLSEGNVTVVQVDKYEAGQQLFSPGWCVQYNRRYFENTYGPPFIMFNLFNRPFALFHPKTGYFKDEHDDSMSIRDTIPLLDALEKLIKNGIIDTSKGGDIYVVEETIDKKNLINALIRQQLVPELEDILFRDLSYSSLIDPYNLTPDIINVINGVFEKEYKMEKAYAGTIINFYKSLPDFLNKNNFPLKPDELEVLQSQMEKFPLSTWDELPKILKTKQLKELCENAILQNVTKKKPIGGAREEADEEALDGPFDTHYDHYIDRDLTLKPVIYRWEDIALDLRNKEIFEMIRQNNMNAMMYLIKESFASSEQGVDQFMDDAMYIWSNAINNEMKSEQYSSRSRPVNYSIELMMETLQKALVAKPELNKRLSPEFKENPEIQKTVMTSYQNQLLRGKWLKWRDVSDEFKTDELRQVALQSLTNWLESIINNILNDRGSGPDWEEDRATTVQYINYMYQKVPKDLRTPEIIDLFKQIIEFQMHISRAADYSLLSSEFLSPSIEKTVLPKRWQVYFEENPDAIAIPLWHALPETAKTIPEMQKIFYTQISQQLLRNPITALHRWHAVPIEFRTEELHQKLQQSATPPSLQPNAKSSNWYKKADITEYDERRLRSINNQVIETVRMGDYDLSLIETYFGPQLALAYQGMNFTDPSEQARKREIRSVPNLDLDGMKNKIRQWINEHGTLMLSAHNVPRIGTYSSILQHLGFSVGETEQFGQPFLTVAQGKNWYKTAAIDWSDFLEDLHSRKDRIRSQATKKGEELGHILDGWTCMNSCRCRKCGALAKINGFYETGGKIEFYGRAFSDPCTVHFDNAPEFTEYSNPNPKNCVL